MFESIVAEYLDNILYKDWSILRILEFTKSNFKLSVDTIKDFKKELYIILQKYEGKCNVHTNAKIKVMKLISNFYIILLY